MLPLFALSALSSAAILLFSASLTNAVPHAVTGQSIPIVNRRAANPHKRTTAEIQSSLRRSREAVVARYVRNTDPEKRKRTNTNSEPLTGAFRSVRVAFPLDAPTLMNPPAALLPMIRC
jgi:hypothetical protein